MRSTALLVTPRLSLQVSLLFASSSTITVASFISPYQADRDLARKLHAEAKPALPFIEIFVDASIDECERRDPKGLYKKARAGEIKGECGWMAAHAGASAEILPSSNDAYRRSHTLALALPSPEFTGVSAPYEAPKAAEIHIDADKTSIEDSVKLITEYLAKNNIIKLPQ